jgi:VCBS repeat-containing protein
MNPVLRGALVCAVFAATGTVQAAAPFAGNDSYQLMQNNAISVIAPGVLANDTDAEDDPLTAATTSDPVYGTVTMQPSGAFTYTPNNNFYGTDSFSYEANDGTAVSNTAVVTLTVTRGGGGGGGYGGGAPSPALLLLLALAALYPRGLKASKRRDISP